MDAKKDGVSKPAGNPPSHIFSRCMMMGVAQLWCRWPAASSGGPAGARGPAPGYQLSLHLCFVLTQARPQTTHSHARQLNDLITTVDRRRLWTQGHGCAFLSAEVVIFDTGSSLPLISCRLSALLVFAHVTLRGSPHSCYCICIHLPRPPWWVMKHPLP